ncbi:MAG: site-specific integrase [Proteobacteria bacterium]|nr:site-specific integrase [Pseudomonadota bacterium]
MAKQERFKTSYPGVFYIEGNAVGRAGTERIYYIRYKREGKLTEEKAGRQYQDDMTPARAAGLRAQRIEGKQKSNQKKREEQAKLADRWTIERLWNEYRKHLPGGEATKTDISRWQLYLQKGFSQKEPKEIVRLDVDRLRINLLKKKSPQTTKHVLALLRRIINFGVDRGLCPPLPFKISLPPVDNIKTEDLSPNHLLALFAVIESTPHQTAAAMMKLALFTGMRRGEIFKLRWDDLDFHRGFIFINEPKGGKSQKIPMNKNAEEVFSTIPKTSEYVFPARTGGPRKDISKDLREIKVAAGLPANFRPLQGLRHVYATMLASSGRVDMITLQKLLTHKSPQMTQRYIHYRDEALRRASDDVDDILNDAMRPKEGKIRAIK